MQHLRRPDSNFAECHRSLIALVGRERCDGVQPTCGTCNTQTRACSYNEQPKKRGIQPNYIRTLEVVIGWLFRTFPESEDILTNALPESNDANRALLAGNDPDATDELHSVWRSSLVNKQLDQMLAGQPIERPGPASHSPIGRQRTERLQTQVRPSVPDPSGGQQHYTDQHQAVGTGYGDVPVHMQEDLSMATPKPLHYRLPSNAWTLLEYYFAFTHSWLPMTEKPSILKIMYAYPSGGLARESLKSAEHAELWSILALAAGQTMGDTTEVDRIRQLADSLIPFSGISYEVPHIKAIILRALDEFQHQNVLAAWLRIGSAVRLLLLFKLLENLGQHERWCRHVHLAAFVLDSALARRLKTISHFKTAYIKEVGLLDEDGLEEWTPWADPLGLPESNIGPAPMKAFSTLNKLVQHFIDYTDMAPAIGVFINTNNDSSIEVVPLLLENAQSKGQRTQPSQIVTAYLDTTTTDPFTWSASERTEFTDTLAGIPGSIVEEDSHAFMTIPNESSSTALELTAGAQDILWPGGSTNSTPAQAIPFSEPSADASSSIFDEFATLKRQESLDQSQFMANFGFPDLDLAEFFGADYQPSDPLLAYLQPHQMHKQKSVESADAYG
jgi:hypothetical protein